MAEMELRSHSGDDARNASGSFNGRGAARLRRQIWGWAGRGEYPFGQVILVVAAFVSGAATWWLVNNQALVVEEHQRNLLYIVLVADLVFALLIALMIVRSVAGIWQAKRASDTSSRLYTRLAIMFGLVSIMPVIVIAAFTTLFFNQSLEVWFGDKVKTALGNSLKVAQAYRNEHISSIVNDLASIGRFFDSQRTNFILQGVPLNLILSNQVNARSLTDGMLFVRDGQIIARHDTLSQLNPTLISEENFAAADRGVASIWDEEGTGEVFGLVKLNAYGDNAYLFIATFIDPNVKKALQEVKKAITDYNAADQARFQFELIFGAIFLAVALLLLLISAWAGLLIANRLVSPISELADATVRVGEGDLTVRVKEHEDDELGQLSSAFNRMINDLDSQRKALVSTNAILDRRTRFSEALLAGVTAGVIGVRADGSVSSVNKSARRILGMEDDVSQDGQFVTCFPVLAPIYEKAIRKNQDRFEEQLTLNEKGRNHHLIVRVTSEKGGEAHGFVVTFDEVTNLVSAQRQAAWADVARRIAHEIKNPLTPIQLSAERLKRKYGKQIEDETGTFNTLTETIVRQVGTIRGMVDEFSSFARMPDPVKKEEDLASLVRQAVALQVVVDRHTRIELGFSKDVKAAFIADGRLLNQVLTNVLKNALESIEGRRQEQQSPEMKGQILVDLTVTDHQITLSIQDNGKGFPDELRDRLTEPYVTTRSKGTGLGLAITKKIIEDHDGILHLDDNPEGGALVRMVFSKQAVAQIEAPDTNDVNGNGVA